ncbi:hypothetical protein B0H13DRAFT_2000445 [Mycena leptocephala]|nr:hypothetical protein B0H13DRAFT_2000445 [Mycena leptocephala]
MKVVLKSSQRSHLCIRSVSADEYWTVSTRLLGLTSADICHFVDGQTALISFHSPLSSFVFVSNSYWQTDSLLPPLDSILPQDPARNKPPPSSVRRINSARNRPVFQFAVAFCPFYISRHRPCTSLLSLFSSLRPWPSPHPAPAKRHVAYSVRTQLPPLYSTSLVISFFKDHECKDLGKDCGTCVPSPQRVSSSGNRATVCNQCDAKKENPCGEFKLVCQAPPGQAYYSCAAKAAPPTPRPACYTDGNYAGSCANPGKSDAYCIPCKQDSDCMRVFTAPKASCVNPGTADTYLEVQGLQYG